MQVRNPRFDLRLAASHGKKKEISRIRKSIESFTKQTKAFSAVHRRIRSKKNDSSVQRNSEFVTRRSAVGGSKHVGFDTVGNDRDREPPDEWTLFYSLC